VRALAKFVSTQAGNRKLLQERLEEAVKQVRVSGQNTAIADEMVERLYVLGILSR
jgi:hypothetical protein